MEAPLLTDADQLTILTNSTILELLKQRFLQDKIYTWAGTTLVAVNPYRFINLPFQLNQSITSRKYDEPHIYKIAENAVNSIRKVAGEKSNTSVIVSGESGSGKTESTKYLLNWITTYNTHTPTKRHAQHLEQQVLSFSPVLEAFGNACTKCNDNSSRFGKYIVLQFDDNTSIVGAYIQTYLLEKTRVVHQGADNFNFHIFYQFLEGLSPEDRDRYLVGDAKVYQYAKSTPNNGYEYDSWSRFLQMWRDAGFTGTHQHQIFEVLGAILCLGNIQFVPHNDDIRVSDSSEAFLLKSSELLGMSKERLSQLLLYRCISASHARRKSVFYKPCTLVEAESRRDCIAKLLYDNLFKFLINHVNCKIKSETHTSFIGLLDIYGFESFQVNSLEQLCINYANERLQLYFVQHYLKDIQAEYLEEGVAWEEIFLCSDNESCVQLMSGSPSIFSLLDEECQLNRIKAQEVSEQLAPLSGHPNLTCRHKDVLNKQFSIQHYAGCVTYSSTGLVEKNMDLIPADIETALVESQSSFVTCLIASNPPAAKGVPKKKTVLSRFKHSLDDLLSKLRSTECMYVRCIKPNNAGKSAIFDDKFVSRQLAACGILETVKIRSQAHSTRISYVTFMSAYKILSPPVDTKSAGKENEGLPKTTHCKNKFKRRTLVPSIQHNEGPQSLLSSPDVAVKHVKNDDEMVCRSIIKSVVSLDMHKLVSYGLSKIFIKSSSILNALEKAKTKKLNICAFSIQCAWRRYKLLKLHKLQDWASRIITRAVKRYLYLKKFKECQRRAPEVLTGGSKDPDANYVVCEYERMLSLPDVEVVAVKQGVHERMALHGPYNTPQVSLAREIFSKDGLVSIRQMFKVKVHFHVRASSILKNSHIAPDMYITQHGILDCIE